MATIPSDTILTNWPSVPAKSDLKPAKKQKPPINPNEPPAHQAGMRVILAPIKGLTPKGTFEAHQTPFLLQCPPQDPFTITFGHDSEEFETIYDGTFSVAAAASLTQIQFSTLFVEDDFPWTLIQSTRFNPWAARALLERLAGGVVFLLTCHHYHADRPEWHGAVTLPAYVHTESEPFTHYENLTFKAYRDPSNERLGHGKEWPIHHKLGPTDTLYSLAKKYYGKPSEARDIARANHIRGIDFNTYIYFLGGRWQLGAVIDIPKPSKPKQTSKPKSHTTYSG